MKMPGDATARTRDITLDTYRYLRGGMAVMIVMLGTAVIGERLMATCWQTSISAYYFTTAHSIFRPQVDSALTAASSPKPKDAPSSPNATPTTRGPCRPAQGHPPHTPTTQRAERACQDRSRHALQGIARSATSMNRPPLSSQHLTSVDNSTAPRTRTSRPGNAERAMTSFRTPGAAQRFLAVFSVISPHFRPRRHRLTADDYRTEMADRLATWNDITRSSQAA
jgi:hypothetical protein